jgi:hypothetical protein
MSRLMPIQPEKATGKAKELLDAVQELLQDVFGKDKNPSRLGEWRRKPSARHSGRAGNHLRGIGMTLTGRASAYLIPRY